MENHNNQNLCNLIAERIAKAPNQKITFAEYMDLLLYHPQLGYYATGAVNIGQKGDFFTSPHLGADFGELLATEFAQMWEILGCPKAFTIVEMGAGQGILAADILRYLQKNYPDFFAVLDYIIIEKAAGLINQQQQILASWVENWGHIYWRTWEEISKNSITGCFFSNELIDAMPVHQIVIAEGQLQEIYVCQSSDGTGFTEITAALSTPRLAQYFDFVGVNLNNTAYVDGYRTEVNLAALDWLNVVAQRLQRGYILTIDYGYPAQRYYNPQRRQGTLQCYYRHRYHDNPYINIGYQDITAHVDFTALQLQGELCELELVGFTKQGIFLMALGLNSRLAAISNSNATSSQDIQELLCHRDKLHQLINPTGLGNFGVLIQSKGLTQEEREQTFTAFQYPPLF